MTYDPDNYAPIDFTHVVAYDVITGSYNDTTRVARFESEKDANTFRDAWNDDLRAGLAQAIFNGDITRGYEHDDILKDQGAYVSKVYKTPTVPRGAAAPRLEFFSEYGSKARRTHAERQDAITKKEG